MNNSFNASSSENSINDYFRGMLTFKGYNEVKDQTRHGTSINQKDAGEVDIFEGLKLDIAASVLVKLRNKVKTSGISYQQCLQLFF